ncbi:unnamed protein product [Lathyrus oleraceus]|uniref:Uncharacterized protein n=1 Tax=Pisum sativum TaxID=3888 RepID=A0A9D4W8X6_PEA|nr:uncharacterized protein LOC127098360 [Pisum sativum]KAI5397680.1 hypothetical protein KIW84_063486 [Pisum sativum]
MGGSASVCVSNTKERKCPEKHVKNLKEKVRILRDEIKEMVCEREKEIMVFTLKEADWKQEMKRMREEVKRLRELVKEKEEKIREMEEEGMVEKNCEKEWELMGTKLLIQEMKEERGRRDEAVEKWKQLYLAIKNELDDLIQRTYDGDGVYWKTEENEIQMENLRNELQEKEESMKALKAKLVSVEKERYKQEREFDLLRQSLRIMNGKKNSIQTKEKKRFKTKLGK